MIRIKTAYFGKLRECTQAGKEILKVAADCRLGGLLDHLATKYGPDFKHLLAPRNSYVILINGHNSLFCDGEKAVLHEGDQVVFMPVTTGG